MKKAFTLFLLSLFLLNVVGYYGVLVGLRMKAGQEWRATFDRDARGTEMLIKVSLAIPYAIDSKEYTEVDGEFEHEGEVYRLVKQRLRMDTLYIVCVKDNTSKKINQALTDYVKTFSDKPFNSKQSTKLAQTLSKDYISSSIAIESLNNGWSFYISTSMVPGSLYSFLFNKDVSQPPQG